MKFRIRHVTSNSSRCVYESYNYDHVQTYIMKMMLEQVEICNVQYDIEKYGISIYFIEKFISTYSQWIPIAKIVYKKDSDWRVIKL